MQSEKSEVAAAPAKLLAEGRKEAAAFWTEEFHRLFAAADEDTVAGVQMRLLLTIGTGTARVLSVALERRQPAAL